MFRLWKMTSFLAGATVSTFASKQKGHGFQSLSGFQLGVRVLPLRGFPGSSGLLPQTEINLGCKRLFVLDLAVRHKAGAGLWPWPLTARSCARSGSAYPLPSPCPEPPLVLHPSLPLLPFSITSHYLLTNVCPLQPSQFCCCVYPPPSIFCGVGGDGGGGGISCVSTALPLLLRAMERMGLKNR